MQGFKSGALLLVPLLQLICCLALKIFPRVCNGNTSVIAHIIWIIDLQQWNCWSNCPFIWKITTWQDHIRPFYSVSSSKCLGVISCWTTGLCIWFLPAPLVIKYRRKRRENCSVFIAVSWSGFIWTERQRILIIKVKYWLENVQVKAADQWNNLRHDEWCAGDNTPAETHCLELTFHWDISGCAPAWSVPSIVSHQLPLVLFRMKSLVASRWSRFSIFLKFFPVLPHPGLYRWNSCAGNKPNSACLWHYNSRFVLVLLKARACPAPLPVGWWLLWDCPMSPPAAPW